MTPDKVERLVSSIKAARRAGRSFDEWKVSAVEALLVGQSRAEDLRDVYYDVLGGEVDRDGKPIVIPIVVW
jgi:hypothetical protein